MGTDEDDWQGDRRNLTLRGLRIFLAVEEAGSIAGAAARSGTSASGISQHITMLEKAVGARLFDRSVRPVGLTPAGYALREHARRIMAVVSEAQTDLAEFSLSSLPRLNLAIIDDLDTSLTPVLVSSLRARYRKCFVHAFSGRSDQIIDRLSLREADIGVTARPPADLAAYLTFPILREPFVLAVAKGAVLPGEAVRDALARLPFVLYSETIPIGQKVADLLRRARIAPQRHFAFETTRSVIAMINQCGGWTVTTPLNLLDAEPLLTGVDILRLPFAGDMRRVHLVARHDELGHLPVELAEECRRIVREKLIPRFAALVPDMAEAISVEEDQAPD